MKLNISEQLQLPGDAATQKIAYIGRTGSGKTYGAGVTVERMLDAGIQVVILDPVGVWYGLRMGASSGQRGFGIPVFGGLHGDIPLESTAGALVADLVVEKSLSIVLDVSQFENDTDKARFAHAFADRFFFLKKARPSAVHVVIEECQEFIPQDPRGNETHMLHAFTRLWKLGRNFGIGGSLITQRPQEVSKKVLNQTELLFAFQMTGSHERKAIKEWASDKGVDRDLVEELPGLPVGTCYAWSPQWLRINERITFNRKQTLNTSSTPEAGTKLRLREAEPVDLENIAEQMKATVERAKENDPALLKSQIVKLDAELRKLYNVKPETKVERIQVPVISEEIRETIADAGCAIGDALDELKKGTELLTGMRGVFEKIDEKVRVAAGKFVPSTRLIDPTTRSAPPAAALMQKFENHRNLDGSPMVGDSLPKGERTMLIACAQNIKATREELTVMTGFKRSTRDLYLQLLKRKLLIMESGDGFVVTQGGMHALGTTFKPLPTGPALLAFHLERLPEGERRVLELLCSYYPKAVSREGISEMCGYKRSTRDLYIQLLNRRRLIVVENDGVKASSMLIG